MPTLRLRDPIESFKNRFFGKLISKSYKKWPLKEKIPPHYFFKVRQPLIISKRAMEQKKQVVDEASKVII